MTANGIIINIGSELIYTVEAGNTTSKCELIYTVETVNTTSKYLSQSRYRPGVAQRVPES